MTGDIPADAGLSGISPRYNHHTIPHSLLAPGRMAEDTWARVLVDEGELLVHRDGDPRPARAAPEAPVVISPGQGFRLASTGRPCRFQLHYFRTAPLADGRALAGLLQRGETAPGPAPQPPASPGDDPPRSEAG